MSGLLPFSREAFFGVFAAYNEAVWPAQPVAYAVATAALILLRSNIRIAPRLALVLVALLWVWTGIAYHWLFFAAINPIARLFALLFVVQGLLMLVEGLRGNAPSLAHGPGWRRPTGYALIVYAMIFYPLLELAMGERYPAMPIFGITPCPLTLFTIGLLLAAARNVRTRLFAIPVLWSLIAGSAAILLQVVADWALFLAAALAVAAALAPSPRTDSAKA